MLNIDRSKKKKEATDHKDSLNKLKTKDPEFYKFLEEQDKSLLTFDPDDMTGKSLSLGYTLSIN